MEKKSQYPSDNDTIESTLLDYRDSTPFKYKKSPTFNSTWVGVHRFIAAGQTFKTSQIAVEQYYTFGELLDYISFLSVNINWDYDLDPETSPEMIYWHKDHCKVLEEMMDTLNKTVPHIYKQIKQLEDNVKAWATKYTGGTAYAPTINSKYL